MTFHRIHRPGATMHLPRPWRSAWAIAGFGLLCAVVVALAIFGVVALVRDGHGGKREANTTTLALPAPNGSSSGMTTTSPTARLSSTTSQPQPSLPGTDAQGFVGYPAARCDPGSTPAVLERTTQSLLVVCEVGPANYYYRGLRLSDGAGIELANAVQSSGGFDVTNPVDGTSYQVRPSGISITLPNGQVYSEPMIEYWASVQTDLMRRTCNSALRNSVMLTGHLPDQANV